MRGPGWRRAGSGLYVRSATAITPTQRIIEAASLLPGYGGVGGWAAAYWLGMRLLDGLGPNGHTRLPVLLCLGSDGKISKRAGIRLSRERLPDTDLVESGGLTCTAPLRTAFDGARTAPCLVEAVVHLDMMLTCELVVRGELATYLAEHRGWRGVQQSRDALALAVLGSRSPPETRMRLIWVRDARLPPPLVNRPVFDLNGRLLGYPDVLDPESGAVLEYDSDDHRELDAHTADNAREEAFEDHGLTVCRATRLDLRGDTAPLVRRMRGARARGLRRDRSLDR